MATKVIEFPRKKAGLSQGKVEVSVAASISFDFVLYDTPLLCCAL